VGKKKKERGTDAEPSLPRLKPFELFFYGEEKRMALGGTLERERDGVALFMALERGGGGPLMEKEREGGEQPPTREANLISSVKEKRREKERKEKKELLKGVLKNGKKKEV